MPSTDRPGSMRRSIVPCCRNTARKEDGARVEGENNEGRDATQRNARGGKGGDIRDVRYDGAREKEGVERGKLVGEYILSKRGEKDVKLTPHWEQHRPGWPMLSHVLDESHGNGSGNTREDGDGDNVVVIGALSLADANECDD
jgi:hypothetical protein